MYNERANLATLVPEIDDAFGGLSFEIVAVDDGSTDGSLDELRSMRGRHPTLRVVSLSAHSGQSAAFAAGFAVSEGEVIVTMDADGQNDPADARRLLAALDGWDGYAAAVGYRLERHDSRWKRVQTRVANVVRNWITRDRIRDTGCSLKAMRRDALRELPEFDGMHRFLPTLIRIQGGRVVEVPVSHRPRRHGVSKYGMWNRGVRGLRDTLGVRWLKQRALRYEIEELDDT